MGNGEVCTSVIDLLKWNRLLHSGKVLSKEAYKIMTGNSDSSVAYYYGYGITMHHKESITHGGATMISNGYYGYNTKSGAYVVALSNVVNGTNADNVTVKIVKDIWMLLGFGELN